jgi:cell wall-associated protease
MKNLAFLCLGFITSLHAANIAIIDSGVDYKHPMLKNNMWSVPSVSFLERYKAKIVGWNFAENNDLVFDHSLLSTFPEGMKRYNEISSKSFLFSATEEEKAWAKEKQKEPGFMQEVNRFSTYIHGTHVAGIAMKNSNNKIMPIKLLPTPAKATITQARVENLNKSNMTSVSEEGNEKEMVFLLSYLAINNGLKMKEIGTFISNNHIDVANGSYGTGIFQALNVANAAFNTVYKRSPTEKELVTFGVLFMDFTIKASEIFVNAAPNTLFVFAAGNDGLSNDDIGFAPANIKTDNTISVAATYQDLFFAPFSNYGTKMVEVAAPGMVVESSIPGDDYLAISGTSQAAPFVANVAGQIKDANPSLTPLEMKNILMSTVDKKEFLKDRVTSGGIVNAERAVFAATMSRNTSIADAVGVSFMMIPVRPSQAKSMNFVIPKNIKPIPMPSMFE